MTLIILLLNRNSPQFTKKMSSMHPKGNTQLQVQKWWVHHISALCLFFFVINLSVPPDNQHQVSNRENTQSYSSLFQNNNASYISRTNSKCQNKKLWKVYHVLYKDSAGGIFFTNVSVHKTQSYIMFI